MGLQESQRTLLGREGPPEILSPTLPASRYFKLNVFTAKVMGRWGVRSVFLALAEMSNSVIFKTTVSLMPATCFCFLLGFWSVSVQKKGHKEERGECGS